MLSKQEKQKYGQVLRQQMKEKQQRKKLQDMQKRGNQRQPQPPREQQPIYKPVPIQKQNSYQRQFVDPKEELQKKLQTQEYNYFGGSGGGAPNRRIPQQNVTNLRNMSQPNNLRFGAEQMMQYSGNTKQYQNEYPNQPQQRVRTVSQQQQFYQGQGMQNPLQSISPQSINYQRQPQGGYYQEGQQGRIPNPYQLQSNQNYSPYNNGFNSNRQELRQPISYELIPENQKNINSRMQQFPPQNQYQQLQNYQQNYPQTNQNQSLNQQKQPTFQLPQNLSHSPAQNQMQYQMMEDTTNQELQEVYKKGGRNLLKLQNQTIDEHMIKQKRKLQIQKQLKQQIEQAERRKKQQKEKLKREEEEQERKHMAYLAEQKRKVEDEQRKVKQAQERVHSENRRNQELRVQMQSEAKRKAEQQRKEKQRRQNDNLRHKEQQKRQQQELEKQKNRKPPQNFSHKDSRINMKPSPRITQDDNISVLSSETSQLQKGFNTAMSKEFFTKQREKKNPSSSENIQFQKFTDQIKKINEEIKDQRKKFDKILDQKDRAEIQKRRAMQQVQRLKIQLKKKMEDDNGKLLRALQADYKNNDFQRLPPQHYKNLNQHQRSSQDYENQYPTFTKKPMRQRQHENLVQKQYESKQGKYIPREQETNQFEQSNVGLISLDGQSKKIPLFLEHAANLTMSQVQDFAKDSAFFQKGPNNRMNGQSPVKQKLNTRIHESIAEEADEDRDYINVNNKSSQSNRNKHTKKESSLYKNQNDELDKLMESRAKSRGGWGEMSSVNSDITKQIDELLRKKQNGMGSNNNGRPSSISNAGKQSLSKQGYAYDGLSLSNLYDNIDSNVGGTLGTNGTLDLDRINGRNEARLKELRNLGVETINTNGDDDLNALDQLLYKYK